ncbi:MAG: threonine/serine ThrE exporter family protein [Planctomycetota bacterium]
MPPLKDPESRQQGIAFLQKMGEALHCFGTPSNRLDEVLNLLSKELGLEASFFSTPSAIFYAYDLPDERGFARLQRVYAHELDLSKLAKLDRLFNKVLDGSIPIAEASDRVDAITNAPPPYPKMLTLAAFATTAAAAVGFFGGGFAETLLAGCSGLGLGILYWMTTFSAAAGRLFEPLGALIVSFIAVMLASTFGASADLATLAGLIVLVPGFSLAIGATELALKHPASGVARLAGAMVTLMMLTIGVMFGRHLAGAFGVSALDEVVPTAMPWWAEPLGLLVAGASLGILFKVEKRDLPWAVAAVFLPYLAFRAGVAEFSLEISIFLGALLAGMFSNVFARKLDRPSLIVRLPGMLILVPGATGFLSLGELAAGDVTAGVEAAYKVCITATALVLGFLVSNIVVPPRKAL